jgi:hypothetical protein
MHARMRTYDILKVAQAASNNFSPSNIIYVWWEAFNQEKKLKLGETLFSQKCHHHFN